MRKYVVFFYDRIYDATAHALGAVPGTLQRHSPLHKSKAYR